MEAVGVYFMDTGAFPQLQLANAAESAVGGFVIQNSVVHIAAMDLPQPWVIKINRHSNLLAGRDGQCSFS